ncbi:tetratricopeptide repeat protein [Millionella massiliensis]|uniref:tetratricopeptide repeat protein n=1 Tax=Millionella massiliensis TaxID=1871023 RepID=UPI0008D998F1|nr:hypothetical protein [Millionella massiliensis]
MGLISYIKKRYYNYKLHKADRLMRANRSAKAEQIYLALLKKQPFAAVRLADYYFSLARNADANRINGLFNKIVNLETAANGVYDIVSYNASLQRISEYIYQRAASLFKAGSFADCCIVLKALNDSRHKTENTLDLYCASRINQALNDVFRTRISDPSFGSHVAVLQEEWSRGKQIQGVGDVVKSCINDLIKQKRFYAANELLAITGGKQEEPCIWDNATQIVSGNDSEATSVALAKTVSTYGEAIILREGISVEESVSIFKNCWKVSKDVHVLMDSLTHAQSESVKDALRNAILDNPREFLADRQLLAEFATWLSQDNDPDSSLRNLEKLHALGYNIEKLYVERLHGWIVTLANDARIVRLDHAQALFPNSTTIIEDKLECAQQYESRKEYDKAISVADSIIGKCNKAYFVKAKAYFHKAIIEKAADEKEVLLFKAFEAIKHVSDHYAAQLNNTITESLVELADLYYASKEKDRAYKVLDKLGREGVKRAVSSIMEHREAEIKALSAASDRLKASNLAVREIDSYGIQEVKQDPVYQTLWDIKIAAALEWLRGTSHAAAVSELERIVSEIESSGFDSATIAAKKGNVLAEIIKRKYLIARDQERSNKLLEAANLYKEISRLEAKRQPTLAALRFIICRLKMQNNQDILDHKDVIYNLLRKAVTTFRAEKEDIAYRFALILLKSGADKEALAVLHEFLPSEEYLKKACEQGEIIKAQAKLADFNNKIEAVKTQTLSSDDAIYFINHMLEYADVIRPILNIPRSTLVKYRNKLKNYAIFKLFEEERYNVAFEKMLKEHADYLDDLSALRNIALTCLNMAESKQITRSNYKEVIAVWLTAIYQERLFVKTLDYTSWNDQYTFTLYDAYGHFSEEEYGDLPDNVTFDDSDDSTLVSIKEVQRSLLDRFEAAIGEEQEYHNFYASQKDAMDAFIALNLDVKCRLVAPYIAKNNEDVFNDITSALEFEREQEYDNWEDVLAVGAAYQLAGAIYTDYSKAKTYFEECMTALTTLDATKFVGTRVSLIKPFDKLQSALVSSINSRISALTSHNKTEFKTNFRFYFVVCDCMKDKTLSFIFSKYILSYVVGEVNDKKIKLSEASEYLLSAYTLDTSNSRIKENLKTLFEMLCEENNTESNTAVSEILSKVQPRDVAFYRSLYAEYQETTITKNLNSIVEGVNNHSLSEKEALKKVYAMYISNPEHKGICRNLAQLAEICVLKYIISDDVDSYSVKTILNGIISNKSVEFRNQSAVFRKAYSDIWNQLPASTQLLLRDEDYLTAIRHSLTAKGIALKTGLNLMKKLGGFTSTDSSQLGSFDLPF